MSLATAADIIQTHRDRGKKPRNRMILQDPEYREHYPTIKEAVKGGVPLRSALRYLRESHDQEKSEDDPRLFGDRSIDTVWASMRRQLVADGVPLKGTKDGE